MTGEAHPGNSGEESLETVSQETLGLLLESVRSKCLTGILAKMGTGGISANRVRQDGRHIGVDLYYYRDEEGPTRSDMDGSKRADTTGRYQHSHDIFYYDTGVQATISILEKADESQADGEKVITSYEIIKSGQQIELDKSVRPFGLPIFLKHGDELIPAEDNPPLISSQERAASEQQEDALGLSMVSESEANELIELLRAI